MHVCPIYLNFIYTLNNSLQKWPFFQDFKNYLKILQMPTSSTDFNIIHYHTTFVAWEKQYVHAARSKLTIKLFNFEARIFFYEIPILKYVIIRQKGNIARNNRV